jgi:hypothetical protein
MALTYFPDFLSLFPLSWALYLLLREQKQFRSLVPFIAGVALLFLGRTSDLLIGWSSASTGGWLATSSRSFVLLVDGLGSLSDALGALFLVVGFIQTIRFQHEEKKTITRLESLLPLCAWCKNYRTPDGVWEPIEQYLIENGGAEVTHGICPSCAAKVKKATAAPKGSW